MNQKPLGSGPGWAVFHRICAAGPEERPYEERHESVCLAAVVEGTFRYRSDAGDALLVPGSILIGNSGNCFECGHEHGRGDRCISFHYEPGYWEGILSSLSGVREDVLDLPQLPPTQQLVPLLSGLEAALEAGDMLAGEIAILFAARVANAALNNPSSSAPTSLRDRARVADAMRLIEERAADTEDGLLSLDVLAREAGVSVFHFLRIFRSVTGMTPHQTVLRVRLQRAAVRLRRSDEPVSTIAFEEGFGDLSTFNRRFRRLMGATPGDWRRRPAGWVV